MDNKNIKIMQQEKLTWDNIPEWAIYALEYGVEEANLSNKDTVLVNTFLQNNFPHGYTMSVNWDQYREFDIFPAFGLPCKTYNIDFIIDNS